MKCAEFIRWTLKALALAALGFTAAEAVAESPQCPATINVRQQLTTRLPGWTSVEDDGPHRLAGITFYDGKPEERASLVPDTSRKSGDRQTSVWKFGSQANRRIWMACSYGGTTIAVAQELPAGTRACLVVYDLRQHINGLPVIERMRCE